VHGKGINFGKKLRKAKKKLLIEGTNFGKEELKTAGPTGSGIGPTGPH
jgi:hypothetical protein